MTHDDNVIQVNFPRHCSLERMANESARLLSPFFEETTMNDDEVLLALHDGVRRAWMKHASSDYDLEFFKQEWADYGRDYLGICYE